jgi:hypothetical protein
MKFANASKLDRKSGVRLGEPGAADSLRLGYDTGFHSISQPEPEAPAPWRVLPAITVATSMRFPPALEE